MRWSFVSVGGCALIGCSLGLASLSEQSVSAEETGELLKATKQARALSAEALRREVQVELDAARQSMATNPRGAIDSLKRLNDHVLGSADFSSADRVAVRHQITAALREAARREVEQEAATQEQLAAKAAAREQQRVLSGFESRETRLKQITERINGLLQERRFELAEEVAATAAEQTAETPLAASLPLNTRTVKYAYDAATTRVARQKGVVAMLASVETTHIPQSDEPSMVYLDAAKWQELTLRRRNTPTDLFEEKSAEVKIRKSLDETTSLDFNETPLGDVVDYLKDLHGIEIQLDTKALDAVGVDSNTPMTTKIRGITLRSALRLLLRNLDLTYTVHDEVLLITTPEVAATILVPRVYNVADIVLPIQDMSFPGGFGPPGGSTNNGFFGANPGQGNQNNFNPFNNNRNGNPIGQNGQNMF